MVTMRQFVGALLQEIARARALSDHASVRLAESYLHDEFLRGFPVPRMQIANLEVELNFALLGHICETERLAEEEIRRNIGHRLEDFLRQATQDHAFHAYFRGDSRLHSEWHAGLDELNQRVQRLLAQPASDCAGVIQSLYLLVHNYFHERAPQDLRGRVADLLSRSGAHSESGAALQTLIEERIRAIVTDTLRRDREGDKDNSEINLLIGAGELAGLPAHCLQKMKITVSHADRRWVATDQDGRKIYILGT